MSDDHVKPAPDAPLHDESSYHGDLLGELPPPLSDEQFKALLSSHAEMAHYSAVGRVAGSWSFLEATVAVSAANLAGIRLDIGACFTSQMLGSANKIFAYMALANLFGTSKELMKELDEFSKTAKSLSEKRNRTVHDPWFFEDAEKPQRLEITAAKKLRYLMVPWSTSYLLDIANEIDSHTTLFSALDDKVQTELKTPRDGARRVVVPADSLWDDFFADPGVDLGERVQPAPRPREPF